jgi:signal peptide peptidase SppA
MILDIVDKRITNGKLTDEEIAIRLEDIGVRANDDGTPRAQSGVGVISLYGPIFGKANLMTQMSGATSLESFRSDLAEMLENDRVHSIVLSIDSPGGTSDGVAETGALINEGRNIKPIYAIADSQAGSAAYWLASQATEVFASPSGSVGSIGAYTVHEDRSVSDAQEGRKYTFISAGPYKTEGNPHEPLTAEGAAYRQEVINEVYDDFVNAIAEGRGVETERVVSDFGGGRMLTAKKALEVGAIDGITTQDALVSTLNRPRGMVQVPATAFTQYHTTNSTHVLPMGFHVDGRVLASAVSAQLEHKEMEHSEPGTGVPPIPRTDDDDSKDKAIEGGWRRDTPPSPGFPPDTVHPATKGGEMDNDVLESLFELYGVSTSEELVSAIWKDHDEASALIQATSMADEESRLAEQYPQTWARLNKLEDTDRNHKADVFVSSVERFMEAENDSFKPTNMVLSALAQDTLRDAHIKFSKGIGTLADFEEVISLIVNGGVVQTGEIGSAREPEVEITDVNTTAGIEYVRAQFAAKIAEVKAELDCDQLTAMREAAKRYPDLAAAYRAAVPS